MAYYTKKTWTDRIAEYVNRRTLTKTSGTTEVVTVTRNEGTVSQEGDVFDASTMNAMETRISNAFDSVSSAISDIWKTVYPVGSIYMSVSSTSPASLFGGSWTQLQNRFLLGAGSSYSNGSTGGESTHTLTTSEMPSHTHTPNSNNTSLTGTWVPNVSNGYARGQVAISTSSSKYAPVMDSMDNFVWGTVASTGGGSSHNNMPPYLVVYMWKRTA